MFPQRSQARLRRRASTLALSRHPKVWLQQSRTSNFSRNRWSISFCLWCPHRVELAIIANQEAPKRRTIIWLVLGRAKRSMCTLRLRYSSSSCYYSSLRKVNTVKGSLYQTHSPQLSATTMLWCWGTANWEVRSKSGSSMTFLQQP